MATATLTIDLDAVAANWHALDRLSAPDVQTAAVVKADAYGLGAPKVARALAKAGARRFFVATAEEGATMRQALGPGPQIAVLSGHLSGDAEMIRDCDLTPILCSLSQITRHMENLPGRAFGLQLDIGMNRLGLSLGEWEAVAAIIIEARPELVMSQLACSDEPEHPANAAQLRRFHQMTDGTGLPRSLAATAGILLGAAYHFDLTRPGIGLYGGLPHAAARPVIGLSLPVIQTHELEPGETVGYGCSWTAKRRSVIATLSAGYGDGLFRTLSNRARLWAGARSCPVVGRVSMDLITADITDLPEVPAALEVFGAHQGLDALAEAAGTIGYELLTALGQRYQRRFQEAAA